MEKNTKCRMCKACNGYGCIGELPGMGGVFENANFIANCADWKKYYSASNENSLPKIRLAPMAGGVENVGYFDERQFYFDLLKGAINAGMPLSTGDGTPDEKLIFALDALKLYHKKAAVFLKPYPQKKLFERIELAANVAEIIGVDIDAYSILTMRNLASLEKKTAEDLDALRKKAQLPFAVKGIFTISDMELVKELKPEIAIISNHGGRIKTERGSTADFAFFHLKEVARYAGEVWIDGGLRTQEDFIAAHTLGASEVLLGRPCITALLKDKENGIKNMMQTIHIK